MVTLKKNKLRIIVAAIVVVIICTAAAVLADYLNSREPSLEEIVSDKLGAYETDFLDSVSTMHADSDMVDYLVSWGENKGIEVTSDSSGNVIFSVKAASGHESTDSYVIMCGYDVQNLQEYAGAIACALTAAKNPQNNCDFKVIFTPESKGDFYGASALSETWFAGNDKVLVLESADEPVISTVTGGYRHMVLSDSLVYTKPEYDLAYRISISNIPTFNANGQIDISPNPLKVLGTLLAEFKTNSLVFELTDLEGGYSINMTPDSGSMTVVISSSDEEEFIKEVDRHIEKFTMKYQNDFPEISFSYEPVSLPGKVISPEDTDNIVSLLYTALDGVYYKDNSGKVVAVTNIGKLTAENNLKIEIAALSLDPILLEEITDSYIIISGLCDVKFAINGEDEPLQSSAASEALASEFEETYSDFSRESADLRSTVEYTPCSVIAKKNPDLSILYCGLSDDSKENFAQTLIGLMDQEKTS